MITQTTVLPTARVKAAPRDAHMDCAVRHALLGDIGATNARFALLSNGAIGPVKTFRVADFARFNDVVRAFYDADPGSASAGERARSAILAVAGPVQDGRCVLT